MIIPSYPSYQFDGYTLRPAEGDDDLALAAEWMRLDAWHRGLFTPEFWLEQSATVNSFVLQDEAGAPIFFFKTQGMRPFQGLEAKVFFDVEIFIQFAPDPGLRTMLALEKGFAWMQKRLGALGYDAVYFTSRNPKLIEFAERRLGFCAMPMLAQNGMLYPRSVDGDVRLKAHLERSA